MDSDDSSFGVVEEPQQADLRVSTNQLRIRQRTNSVVAILKESAETKVEEKEEEKHSKSEKAGKKSKRRTQKLWKLLTGKGENYEEKSKRKSSQTPHTSSGDKLKKAIQSGRERVNTFLKFPWFAPKHKTEEIDIWDQPLHLSKDVLSETLDSGFQYYVLKNTCPVNRVYLKLVVQVGSIVEEENELGFAHFIEHLAFRCTQNFRDNTIKKYMESIGLDFGADINAQTGFDSTIYDLVIPVDDNNLSEDSKAYEYLKQAIWIMSDWAQRVDITEEAVEQEKKIVYEEWRVGQNKKSQKNYDELRIIFKGSSYAHRFPIGKSETILNATADDLRNFYKKWYHPHLMAIVVVGDMKRPEIVVDMIKEKFGTPTSQPIPKIVNPTNLIKPSLRESWISIQEQSEFPFVNIRSHSDESVSRILLVFRMPDWTRNRRISNLKIEKHKLDVFILLLSALTQRVGKLAIGDSTILDLDVHTERLTKTLIYMECCVVVKPGTELQTFKKIMIELERLKKHGITEAELKKVVQFLQNLVQTAYDDRNNIQSIEHIEELVEYYLYHEIYLSPEDSLELGKTISNAWTVTDFVVSAQKVFRLDSLIVSALVPEKVAQSLLSEHFQDAIYEIHEMNLEPEETVNIIDFTKMIDPKKLYERAEGVLLSVKQSPNLPWIECELSNGAFVILRSDDGLGNNYDELAFGIQLILTGRGRGLAEAYLASFENYVSTSMCCSLATKCEIAGLKPEEFLRLPLECQIFPEAMEIKLFNREMKVGCLGTSLEHMLQYVHCLFTHHADSWSEEECKRQIEVSKEFLETSELTPQMLHERRTNEINHMDNPLQRSLRPEDLDSIDIEMARKAFEMTFSNPAEFTFTFIGNFSSFPQLISLICQYVGTIPAKNEGPYDPQISEKRQIDSIMNLKVDFPSEVIKEVIFCGDDPSGSVKITFPAPALDDSGNPYLVSLCCQVLESRLYNLLRVVHGAVYGVSVSPKYDFSKYLPGQFTIQFTCDPTQVEKLIELTFEVIEQLRNDTLKKEEIESVCKMFEKRQELTLQSREYWLDSLSRMEKTSNGESEAKNITQVMGFIAYQESIQAFLEASSVEVFKALFPLNIYTIIVLLPETFKETFTNKEYRHYQISERTKILSSSN